MHYNTRISNNLINNSHKHRTSFISKFKRLKKKCKTVPNIIKVSKEIENSILKLELLKSTNQISNTKYNTEMFGWLRTQQELLNILDVLLDNLKVENIVDNQSYRYKARFNITIDNISDIKGYNKLQELGFYNKNNNPNGVVKDHRFSIKSGLVLNIPPEYLGNINNCEFLTHKDNILKSSNNSLTFEEFCKLTNYCPV